MSKKTKVTKANTVGGPWIEEHVLNAYSLKFVFTLERNLLLQSFDLPFFGY